MHFKFCRTLQIGKRSWLIGEAVSCRIISPAFWKTICRQSSSPSMWTTSPKLSGTEFLPTWFSSTQTLTALVRRQLFSKSQKDSGQTVAPFVVKSPLASCWLLTEDSNSLQRQCREGDRWEGSEGGEGSASGRSGSRPSVGSRCRKPLRWLTFRGFLRPQYISQGLLLERNLLLLQS